MSLQAAPTVYAAAFFIGGLVVLVAGVGLVPGVTGVESLLHPPGTPAPNKPATGVVVAARPARQSGERRVTAHLAAHMTA